MKNQTLCIFIYLLFSISISAAFDCNDLYSEDTKKANSAYEACFEQGFEAIPKLIKLIKSDKKFYGNSHENILSSLTVDNVTVGIISMYLVDSILKGNKSFYLAPYIISKKNITRESGFYIPEDDPKYLAVIKNVSEIYDNWYSEEFLPSEDKKAVNLPLAGSEFRWFGRD